MWELQDGGQGDPCWVETSSEVTALGPRPAVQIWASDLMSPVDEEAS